jgi:hypothetical protein
MTDAERIRELEAEVVSRERDAAFTRGYRQQFADMLAVPHPQAEGRVWEAVLARLTALEAECGHWKAMFQPVDERTRLRFEFGLMERLLDSDSKGAERLGQVFVAWHQAERKAEALEAENARLRGNTPHTRSHEGLP